MKNQISIKRFVQNILGCTCPDKVFELIEDKIILPSNSPHTRSITIGNKLLIYIWKVDDLKNMQHGIPAMLAAGKKERDVRGLNRFRAVLAVESQQDAVFLANEQFFLYKGRDERMHIHVISIDDLKKF